MRRLTRNVVYSYMALTAIGLLLLLLMHFLRGASLPDLSVAIAGQLLMLAMWRGLLRGSRAAYVISIVALGCLCAAGLVGLLLTIGYHNPDPVFRTDAEVVGEAVVCYGTVIFLGGTPPFLFPSMCANPASARVWAVVLALMAALPLWRLLVEGRAFRSGDASAPSSEGTCA